MNLSQAVQEIWQTQFDVPYPDIWGSIWALTLNINIY